MRIRPGIELAGLSDIGCQRENNEDRYSYWEPASDEQFQRKGRLAIVADGMGGYEGGQEASRIAVQAVEEVYSNDTSADPEFLLRASFQAAHRRIIQQAHEHPELHGMGTTCTAAALLGQRLYYAHLGDSRLYLVRDSSISRLTRDHSYVNRLVENGVISSEEAESHSQRHILTAALGSGIGEISPDLPEQPIELKKSDVLLLCTDGLWSVVSEDEIKGAVEQEDLQKACRDLVHAAKRLGGPDNITLQILRLT
jgi:serine/threonine protein phosphatase PrpC